MTGLTVYLGKMFKKELSNFPQDDILKIQNFILHIQKKGFNGLPGKNKSSDSVPYDDMLWLEKVRFAQQYNLWHYHIGIPDYDTSHGEGRYTSEYVLHYIKGDGYIKIVDMTPHPPFVLPTNMYLDDMI